MVEQLLWVQMAPYTDSCVVTDTPRVRGLTYNIFDELRILICRILYDAKCRFVMSGELVQCNKRGYNYCNVCFAHAVLINEGSSFVKVSEFGVDHVAR